MQANPLPTLALSCFDNPARDRTQAYGARRTEILGQAALAQARQALSHWQGYAVTPLHSLPALAQALGVAAVHYKDEGGRFGLGSFKALGGAYAVAVFLPGMTLLGHPLCRLATGLIMALGAFRRRWRQAALFFLLAGGLAGVVLALGLVEADP